MRAAERISFRWGNLLSELTGDQCESPRPELAGALAPGFSFGGLRGSDFMAFDPPLKPHPARPLKIGLPISRRPKTLFWP